MTIPAYIEAQPLERQELLQELHKAITSGDQSVVAEVGTMMRSEMIIYQQNGQMKYALSSVKNHLSLHCLPIYMVPALHAKYAAMLPDANVQKGCINFKNAHEMPLAIAADLIAECALINLTELLAARKKK